MNFPLRLFQRVFSLKKSSILQQGLVVLTGCAIMLTILAQNANSFSVPVSEPLASGETSASQFEVRSRVERYFHEKLQDMFDRVVGGGKSVVSVSVELDFDQIERTEEKYDPDGVVVRSEQRQKETSFPSQSEGAAGMTSDVAGPASTAGQAGGPLKETSFSIASYEISKTIDHIIKSKSSIKNISVAVMVDGSYNQVKHPNGTVTNEYAPRSEEDLQNYRRMVLAAIGNPAAKNIEIINVPLSAVEAEKEREQAAAAHEEEKRNLYLLLVKTAIAIVSLVLLFLLIRSVVRRIMLGLPPKSGNGEVGGRVNLLTGEEADLVTEVNQFVERKPEQAASLVKVWLKEQQ